MTPEWLQALAYCVGLHCLLWDHSVTYKGLWRRLWYWWLDSRPRPQIRLYGRLAADVREALGNG